MKVKAFLFFLYKLGNKKSGQPLPRSAYKTWLNCCRPFLNKGPERSRRMDGFLYGCNQLIYLLFSKFHSLILRCMYTEKVQSIILHSLKTPFATHWGPLHSEKYTQNKKRVTLALKKVPLLHI